MSDTPSSRSAPAPGRLSAWDAGSLIVGIVVGTSIFKMPPLVFNNVHCPWSGLGVWGAGGVLSIIGALCYCELATTYPRLGGDYEYLSRAFGRWLGFLFGWTQLAVILTGSIGVMAFVFADYAAKLSVVLGEHRPAVAAAAILSLMLLNLRGAAAGKGTQNLLTAAKVAGLAAILIAGLIALTLPETAGLAAASSEAVETNYGLAFVFVLYAFGGWNDAAFVAAEVRDLERNVPRALILGVGGITLLYLAINAAYLAALGWDGIRASDAPAADVLARVAGPVGAKGVSLLVMISALGAINGMMFSGARVFATLGADYRAFAMLGRWNDRGTPVWSFVSIAIVSLLLVLAVGTSGGRAALDECLTAVGLSALPWEQYYGGFETLISGTAPVFWLFFLLTGLSLFILRIKDGGRPRPFRVPFYPLTPLLFCATSVYMLYSSVMYAKLLSLIGLVPVLAGLVLYVVVGNRK